MSKPQQKKSPKAKPEPAMGDFHPRTDAQRAALAALDRCQLVFLIGPAGTGKTMIAAWYATRRLNNKTARQVILSRPPVESGESIGALPGDEKQKMDPYMRPLMKALNLFLPPGKLPEFINRKVIEVVSPTFLRGETYHDTVCIYDEMQNATPDQLKTALTRAGENTTMIVTMDPSQVDLPPSKQSAYFDVGRFANRGNIAIIEFSGEDVVRSQLVKDIIACYQD
jgi:phosphate starvation-inducible PhoH-like protein